MTRLFPKKMVVPKRSRLEDVTLRDFSGGWNVVANDQSISPKYFPRLINWHRRGNGGQAIRFGSAWFADLTGTITGTNVIDMEYFASRIVAVSDTGQIATMNDTGTKTKIWDTAIAALLPGAPSGWNAVQTRMDFVPFKSQLIVHNGVDKPVTVSNVFAVTYLQDLATGSNVFVPIGKYGCVVSNYHCVAGIAAAPTTIYVSSKGTAGTFIGAPVPNDGITIDVGAYAPEGAPEIKGIAGFRTNLIVFFEGQSLVIKLGVYNDAGVHTPEFPDAMPKFGLLNHRCIVGFENDLTFAGIVGFGSAKRNLLSGLLESESLGENIEPEYRKTIGGLTDTERALSCFSVYDELDHETLLFTPEGRTFVYSANEKLRTKGWSEYQDIEAQCACSSFLGRVFVADGMRVYQRGNRVFSGEDYHADKILDRDANWSAGAHYSPGKLLYDSTEGKVYETLIPVVLGSVSFARDRIEQPSVWSEYKGEAIDVDGLLPWIDGKHPMQVKHLRFMNAATKGTAEFTIEIYVDNFFEKIFEDKALLADSDGAILVDLDGYPLETVQYVNNEPAVKMKFIGNDALGFGSGSDEPYGAGRRSADPRRLNTPVRFEIMRPRIVASTREPLEINRITFLFARGGFGR